MRKTKVLAARLDPEERAALLRAAAADDRPASAMIRRIVADWLRRNGWLSATPPPVNE